MITAPAFADTNDIPPLLPPHDVLAPTMWEQNSRRVMAGGAAALVLVGVAVWWLARPKPIVVVPPHVTALYDLEPLRSAPENGASLSQISHILKHYVTAAFGLPAIELTTKELCQAITADERFGPELPGALADFLRRCDERKFSPPGPGPAQGAAAQAIELIGRAETCRTGLRPAEAAVASGGTPEKAKR